MNYRRFGTTDLHISEIGFGAWAIGGPAMAGDIPIGWGDIDDRTSISALKKSLDLGINFYDTADFYGLGHSEELIGKVFGNRHDVIIATREASVGMASANFQILSWLSLKMAIFMLCSFSIR